MGRKCSVFGCSSKYDSKKFAESGEKTSVYSFPSDNDECREWLRRLPNIIHLENVTGNMGVCSLHFPKNIPMRKVGGRERPAVPPSIFNNVNESSIPSVAKTTPHPTKKAIREARAIPEEDPMETFHAQDCIFLETFKEEFKNRFQNTGFIATQGNECMIFSASRTGAVHSFSSYFRIVGGTGSSVTLEYEAFRSLKRVRHSFLKDLKLWRKWCAL